jgi:hypothetical protein
MPADHETRTRDLCRDRVAWIVLQQLTTAVETAKVRGSRARHHLLWVVLWVENDQPLNHRPVFAVPPGRRTDQDA